MFSAGRQPWLCGSAGSPGGPSRGCQTHPPPPPARPAAVWVSWSTRDLSQLENPPKTPKEKAAKGLPEERKGQSSCQMVASPAGRCGGSARVAGTGGDTMETFRLAPHTNTRRQAGQKGAYSWLLREGFAVRCCCVLCLQLPVWKCFFPLTPTHQPGGFGCRFPSIWRIHQQT